MAAPPAAYKIYATAVKATDLISGDKKGKSDPYVVLQLRGKPTLPKVKSAVVENNQNPEWNQALDPLDGYFLASDVLKVLVYDKDGDSGKGDDLIGVIDLPLRDASPGKVVDTTLDLAPTGPSAKYQSGKGRKNAGTIYLKLHVAPLDATPYEDTEFGTAFLTATVTFVSATGVPVSDGIFNGGKADPYVKASITPAANKQKQQTHWKKNTLEPKWGETKKFVLADQGQSLKLKLFDFDSKPGNKNDKLAVGQLEFGEFTPGADFVEKSVTLQRTDKYASKAKGDTVLKLKVKLEGFIPKETGGTPGVKVIEGAGDCEFYWGDYTSAYSTDFTGYDKEDPLSDLDPAVQEIHYHVPAEPDPKEDAHVKTKKTVSGKVTQATGLVAATAGGTDSYVTIELKSGGKTKQGPVNGEVNAGTQSPTWGTEFNFAGAKHGAYVLVTVRQKSDADFPIGWARIKVKDIPNDGEEHAIETNLFPPLDLPKIDPLPPADQWGLITVVAKAVDEPAAGGA